MILTGLVEVKDPKEIHSSIPHLVHNKMRLVRQKLTVSLTAWRVDAHSPSVPAFFFFTIFCLSVKGESLSTIFINVHITFIIEG